MKPPVRNAHIVCYSGGESSALVAVEVARKYGTESLVLLNHDIHGNSEHSDIKRFKVEVAAFIGVQITYANMARKATEPMSVPPSTRPEVANHDLV